MPTWVLNLIKEFPQLAAEILAIIAQIEGGVATPAQKAKLAAYSSAMHGMSELVNYHANE